MSTWDKLISRIATLPKDMRFSELRKILKVVEEETSNEND